MSAAGRLDGEAVERVLAAAGHRRAARPPLPAGLTAREAEVLRLLAARADHPPGRRPARHHAEDRRSPRAAHLHEDRRVDPRRRHAVRHRARHPRHRVLTAATAQVLRPQRAASCAVAEVIRRWRCSPRRTSSGWDVPDRTAASARRSTSPSRRAGPVVDPTGHRRRRRTCAGRPGRTASARGRRGRPEWWPTSWPGLPNHPRGYR